MIETAQSRAIIRLESDTFFNFFLNSYLSISLQRQKIDKRYKTANIPYSLSENV